MLEGIEARGPFLRGPERRLMAQLGARLWVAVRVYLRLQEVIDLEFSGLSWTPVEPRDDVDPVIGEYAEIIFDAMGEIRAAALELRAVQDLLAGAGIEHGGVVP